jgi:hypothetical protein
MFNCKEVVRILGSGEKLSLPQRAQLRLHLWMCKHCGTYAHQMKAMKDGFSKMFSEKTAVDREIVSQVESDVLNAIGQENKKS